MKVRLGAEPLKWQASGQQGPVGTGSMEQRGQESKSP